MVLINIFMIKIRSSVEMLHYNITVDLLSIARYRDHTVPDRSHSTTVHVLTSITFHRSRVNVRHRPPLSVHRSRFKVRHRTPSPFKG